MERAMVQSAMRLLSIAVANCSSSWQFGATRSNFQSHAGSGSNATHSRCPRNVERAPRAGVSLIKLVNASAYGDVVGSMVPANAA